MSSWPLSSRRLRVLSALIMWCGVLLVLRVLRTGSPAFGFLVWNLFLAGLPALAALGYAYADTRRAPSLVKLALFAVWLVFLPNAPYLLSDLVHLGPRWPVPLWYDVTLMLAFAGTGLLLGYASIADVQAVVTRRHGIRAGWAVALGALALCGFGIYLGRFLRWNSWDVLVSPLELLSHVTDRIMNPALHPRTLVFTVVWGVGLALGYVAVRVIGPEPADAPRRG